MMFKPETRKPDFRNIEAVLSKKRPSRPTLFEFYLNDRLYEQLAGKENFHSNGFFPKCETIVKAYYNAGYDYATVKASDFFFLNDTRVQDKEKDAKSRSMNEGAAITDWESFEKFVWNEPDDFDMSDFKRVKEYLPEGMKLIVFGPGGVEENVIELVGYENLCYMMYEEPELVEKIFECVGTRMLRYYELALEEPTVGAIISNDDWGYNTQTLLHPDQLRKYVFPWHRKIVELAHSKGVFALLHSCGYYRDIIDEVIDDLKFDGRHSYQDCIVPVEEAYEEFKSRLAVLGGLDMDFVARSTPKEVFERARAMVMRAEADGGYALGTGNSIPEYIPDENYYAMISAAWKECWEE